MNQIPTVIVSLWTIIVEGIEFYHKDLHMYSTFTNWVFNRNFTENTFHLEIHNSARSSFSIKGNKDYLYT